MSDYLCLIIWSGCMSLFATLSVCLCLPVSVIVSVFVPLCECTPVDVITEPRLYQIKSRIDIMPKRIPTTRLKILIDFEPGYSYENNSCEKFL